MIDDLIADLDTVYAEQKRLAEVEDVLQTMRSVAIEATTCGDERRVQLDAQFQELQTHLTYLETEKREPFVDVKLIWLLRVLSEGADYPLSLYNQGKGRENNGSYPGTVG